MKRIRSIGIFSVGLVALSGNMFADISETFSHTTATTNIGTGFTDNFTFASFDTNLGTLTGITLDLVTNGTVNVQVLNIGSSPGSFTNATADFPLVVTGPGGATISSSLADGPISGSVAGGFGITTFPGVATNGSAIQNLDSGLFADFETDGAGSLNFSASSGETGSFGTYSGTTADSSIFFGGDGEIGGVTSITYTYEAVTPEPALLGVVSLCLGGLMLIRRKSLRKNQ